MSGKAFIFHRFVLTHDLVWIIPSKFFFFFAISVHICFDDEQSHNGYQYMNWMADNSILLIIRNRKRYHRSDRMQQIISFGLCTLIWCHRIFSLVKLLKCICYLNTPHSLVDFSIVAMFFFAFFPLIYNVLAVSISGIVIFIVIQPSKCT